MPWGSSLSRGIWAKSAARSSAFFAGAPVLESSIGACSYRRTGTHPGSSPGQAFAGTCAKLPAAAHGAAMPEVFVAKAAELPDGERRIVAHDGVEIGVFHWQGRFYAYQNLCVHRGGQALLAAAVRIYADRMEHRDEALAAFPPGAGITATQAMVTITAILEAVNVQLFELGMWQAWSRH